MLETETVNEGADTAPRCSSGQYVCAGHACAMTFQIPGFWNSIVTSLVGVFIESSQEPEPRSSAYRLRRAVRANAGATDAQGKGEAQLEAEKRA